MNIKKKVERVGIKRRMKIQYISDLHLEFYDLTKIVRFLMHIPKKADICVLAGDIGYPFQKTYEVFLKGISRKFEHVFLILGNHEFYQLKENQGKSVEEIIAKTKEIMEKNELTNVHFLHNSFYDIGEYRFVGSILWSHIYDDKYLTNDYEQVYEFTIEKMNEMHKECKEYIKETLEMSFKEEKKVIMITHHLPSFQLNHPKYAHYINYHQCFSSHSDDLIVEPVKAWIFGHTHAVIDKRIKGIQCVSNPIGYPGQNVDIQFGRTIDVE